MADRENSIKTRVEIDANQAQQEIAKLNAIASDSTQEVVTRLSAKNKQTEIQNKLSKQTISQYEKEIKQLKESGAEQKDIEKVQKKLNAAKLKATKSTAANEKAQRKLNQAYKDSKNPIKGLDNATGGLISKMQAFLANPIGVVIVALVGAFKLFKKAINSTEDGAASFNAIMAALGQVFTNLITLLSDALQPILEFLVDLFTKDLNPVFEKFTGFVDAAKLAFKGWLDYINLLLTPIKALIAGVIAAGKAIKGDFSGAQDVLKEFGQTTSDTAKSMVDNFKAAGSKVVDTVNEIGTSFKEATSDADSLISRAAQIEMAQNALNKAKRDQQLLDAKLNVQAREALITFEDQAQTLEDRTAALEEFRRIENERQQRATELLNEEIRLQRERMSLGGNTREDEEALNQLLIQRVNLQAKLADQERKFFTFEKRVRNEREAAEARRLAAEEKAEQERIEKEQERQERELEAQLELDELDIERRREKGERVLELELELLERRKEQELNNEELLESERNAIIESYSLKAQKLKRTEADAKSAAENKYKENAIAAAGEAFGISKELSLAQMLLSLPETIASSIKSGAGLPFPANVAAVATNLATQVPPIVKGIQTIKSVQGPSGSTGGGGSGSSGAAGGATAAITDIAANNAARLGQDPSLSQNSTQTASAAVSGMSKANVVFSEDSYNDFQGQVQYKEDKTSF